MDRHLPLPEDPAEALRIVLAESGPLLIFKKSPICPTSFAAEHALRRFLQELAPEQTLRLAEIDVIKERALARGLTALLGITHESPQALFFQDGRLSWHASHGAINQDSLSALLA